MNSTIAHGRRVTLTIAGAFALVSMIVVLALGESESHAESAHGHPAAARTVKQQAFHDGMRKLWEDHITWTRLAIISFAHDLPDLPATEKRLLSNQDDIGHAVAAYYGKPAGTELTKLLKAHIVGAVTVMQAVRSGDQNKISKASAEWYVNGNQVADLLHSVNPGNWPKAEMRSMMKAHLDETLAEAGDRLSGKFAADIADYDAVHRHILVMADMLSDGIVKQFPRRFR